MESIKVIELFAGVGGFRLGLEGWKGMSSSSGYKKPLKTNFEVVWSNQFEPSTKKIQHANIIYKKKWPDSNHSEKDIEYVIENEFNKIPQCNLLVGGFPCQDYSVIQSLKFSKGLIGKKGVLWWSIYTIIKRKKIKPEFLLLENVPRLTATPTTNRGKDFFTILCCLNEIGYAVEWRIIDASNYQAPQSRKRIYIFGIHKSSNYYKAIQNLSLEKIILEKGVLAKAFKHKRKNAKEFRGNTCDIELISRKYKYSKSPFKNAGILMNGEFLSFESNPVKDRNGKTLNDIIQDANEVSCQHKLDFKKPLKNFVEIYHRNGEKEVLKTTGDLWRFKKGQKKVWKFNSKSGYKYKYDEGKMNLFEDLKKPSRTIVTREYTKTPNRMTHLIKQGQTIRNLTAIEIEKLNMFPENHTLDEKISVGRRSFLMGNALVVGIIEKIGIELEKVIEKYGL